MRGFRSSRFSLVELTLELMGSNLFSSKKLAERVGFESTRKRNFRELCGMMSILKHSKKSLGLVIAP